MGESNNIKIEATKIGNKLFSESADFTRVQNPADPDVIAAYSRRSRTFDNDILYLNKLYDINENTYQRIFRNIEEKLYREKYHSETPPAGLGDGYQIRYAYFLPIFEEEYLKIPEAREHAKNVFIDQYVKGEDFDRNSFKKNINTKPQWKSPSEYILKKIKETKEEKQRAAAQAAYNAEAPARALAAAQAAAQARVIERHKKAADRKRYRNRRGYHKDEVDTAAQIYKEYGVDEKFLKPFFNKNMYRNLIISKSDKLNKGPNEEYIVKYGNESNSMFIEQIKQEMQQEMDRLWAEKIAKNEVNRYAKVPMGNLLELNKSHEPNLLEFGPTKAGLNARAKELEGLFGGKRTSKKTRRNRKNRRSTRRA